MSPFWFVPLHSGLAAHDWLLQAAVILMIAGVWLFLAGAIERRAARRQRQGSERPVNH
ncbi:MAG: hypothetical protein M3464_00620 [Chloroflexota bacterium]|nr:hypothetical protein [Chloroflexota bacterium]